MAIRKNKLNENLLTASSELFEPTQQRITGFPELVNEHNRFCLSKGLSEHTLKYYRKEAAAFTKSMAIMEIDISDVSKMKPEHFQMFIENQFESKFAASTINSRLRAVKTIFEYAKLRGYITSSPAASVPNVKVRQDVKDTYSKTHISALLKQPDISTTVGVRDRTIILMFAHTGIRLSELAAITENDINIIDSSVIIQRTKNGRARRIPLTKELNAALRFYLQVRSSMEPKTSALYVTENGTPLSVRQIQYLIRNYGKRANITDVNPTVHAFRRFFITEKIRAGVDLFTLAAMVGHSDLSILQRYFNLNSSDLDNAIERGL